MTSTDLIENSRRAGKAFARDLTRQTGALAGSLEAGVSKRALAEALATTAVVGGLIDGRTPAQVEADLMAELRHYEEAAALRQAARVHRERSEP